MCRELKHIFQVVLHKLMELLTRKWVYYSLTLNFWERAIHICLLFLIISIFFISNKILFFIIWKYMLPIKYKLKILICKIILLMISFQDVPCCGNPAVL